MSEFDYLSECDQCFYIRHGYLEPIGSMYDVESYGEESIPNMVEAKGFKNSNYESIESILRDFRWFHYINGRTKRNNKENAYLKQMPYLYGFYLNDEFVNFDTDVKFLHLPTDIKEYLYANNIMTFKQVVDEEKRIKSFLPAHLLLVFQQFIDDLVLKRIIE